MSENQSYDAIPKYKPIVENPSGESGLVENIRNLTTYCNTFQYANHSLVTEQVLTEKIFLPAFAMKQESIESGKNIDLNTAIELTKIIANIGTSLIKPFDGLVTGQTIDKNGVSFNTTRNEDYKRQDSLSIQVTTKDGKKRHINVTVVWQTENDTVIKTSENQPGNRQQRQLEDLHQKLEQHPDKIAGIFYSFV